MRVPDRSLDTTRNDVQMKERRVDLALELEPAFGIPDEGRAVVTAILGECLIDHYRIDLRLLIFDATNFVRSSTAAPSAHWHSAATRKANAPICASWAWHSW